MSRKETIMKAVALKVQGYRSLVDMSLTLHPLTVMIGPNGSGKTSVLEVFQLLRNAVQENLADALERLGGVEGVLSRVPNGPDRLRLELQLDVESKRSTDPMCYRFELMPRGTGYVIPFERLEWRFNPGAEQPFRYIDGHYDRIRFMDPEQVWRTPTWDYHILELALAQVPRMFEEPETLRSLLARTKHYAALDVAQRAVVRLPQPLTPATSPGPNGENLYSALYNLRAGQSAVYERLEDVLQLAFLGFRRLEFPVVGAGQVTLAWHEDHLTRPLYPGELSEGTLRFLWLVALLLAPDPPPITLIDEPEVSLHPELLKLVAGLLQDASSRSQLIVATHSADLVRWLQPDEVLVLDKTQAHTRCTWADTLNLDEWLKDFTLAELWQMGTLGDRP
jgi:predicted ATPase